MKLFALMCSLGVATIAVAGTSETDVRSDSLSLDAVLRAVSASNPSIKAAAAKWQAMKARVPQAAAWEDLRLHAQSLAGR
ncbi:MAG: hypothetical protein ABJB09_07045, partial [Verrucomicrobiota bacterium]